MSIRRQVTRAAATHTQSFSRSLPSGGGPSFMGYYDYGLVWGVEGPVDWSNSASLEMAGDWETYFEARSDGIVVLQDSLCRVSFGCYINNFNGEGNASMQLYNGWMSGPVCDPLASTLGYGTIGLSITYPCFGGWNLQTYFTGPANYMDAYLQVEYLGPTVVSVPT